MQYLGGVKKPHLKTILAMTNKEPYQILFPLGILSAILAIGVWLFQDLNWFSIPAVMVHSRLVIGGFLWSFILGFLITAAPRMTGTRPANSIEMVFAVLFVLAQMIFSWKFDPRPFYGTTIALILFVAIYVGRRVMVKTRQFPVFFSHIALAMFLAFLGAIFHYRGKAFMGIHLYQVGMVLLLVLGIGTRFFSFLAGLPPAFETSKLKWKHWTFHGLGVLMVLFLIVSGRGISAGYLGLTIVALVYLFLVWKVQRPSARPSALKYGVRFVAAMIPLSFFLAWLQPHMFILWFHLLFIGCFGLVTFSVATRVTLAHGAYPIDSEMKSRALWVMVVFFVASLTARMWYGFASPDIRKHALHLAATFWVLAVISWSWSFLGRLVNPKGKSADKPGSPSLPHARPARAAMPIQ